MTMAYADVHAGFRDIAYSSEFIAIVSDDNNLRIWCAKTRKLLYCIKQACWNNRIAISPNNKFIVTTGETHSISIYDVYKGELIKSFTVHEQDCPITSLFFSKEGDLFTGSFDGKIRKWSIPNADNLGIVLDHVHHIHDASFNGPFVALEKCNKTASLWSMQTGKLVMGFPGKRAALSPTGPLMAAYNGSDKVRIYCVGTLDILKTFDTDNVTRLLFSPNGQYLAVQRANNTVTIECVFEDEWRVIMAVMGGIYFKSTPLGSFLLSDGDNGCVRKVCSFLVC